MLVSSSHLKFESSSILRPLRKHVFAKTREQSELEKMLDVGEISEDARLIS